MAVMIAIGLLVLAIVVAQTLSRRGPPDWLPAELRDAKIASREQQYSGHVGGFHVVAKPDRVYQLPDGTQVITELKTRFGNDAYEGDILQLSAGAALLAAGSHVADYGYVFIEHPKTKKRVSKKVQLLDATKLQGVMQRYVDVKSGRVEPKRCNVVKKCRQCLHAARCNPETK